jgi:hypothetical protein
VVEEPVVDAGLLALARALVLAAMWIGGDRAGGLKSLAVFVALAALFAFGGRSDTLRGLGGPAETSAGR